MKEWATDSSENPGYAYAV